MRVMKFGGSSLSSPQSLETVTDLVAEASIRKRVVVVVSAVGGVTDQLSDLVQNVGEPDRSVAEDLRSLKEPGVKLGDPQCPPCLLCRVSSRASTRLSQPVIQSFLNQEDYFVRPLGRLVLKWKPDHTL